MTYLPKAQYLTDNEMIANILAIPATGFKPNPNTNRIWSPKGVTWHNSGNPGLGLWNKYSEATKLAWGDNLNHYYKGMGWHSGPHACGTPSGYGIKLCDWQADGIHASCYNEDHFGVETVGNFCTSGDDPTTGDGLAAMQSSANIIAALCVRFNFDVGTQVNFHRECTEDHHACPGNLVTDNFAWNLVIDRVNDIQKSMNYKTPALVSPPAPTVSFAIPAWPSAASVMWARAAQIVNALRSKGAGNHLVVAALANAYAESAMSPKIVGDNDEAYSIWQWHWTPRGERILAGFGVDVRTETSVSKLVGAFWWELGTVFPKTLAELTSATSAEDATRILCTEYEGAGAPNAADRRVEEAAYLTVWLARNEAFIKANPAT